MTMSKKFNVGDKVILVSNRGDWHPHCEYPKYGTIGVVSECFYWDAYMVKFPCHTVKSCLGVVVSEKDLKRIYMNNEENSGGEDVFNAIGKKLVYNWDGKSGAPLWHPPTGVVCTVKRVCKDEFFIEWESDRHKDNNLCWLHYSKIRFVKED